MYPLSHVTFACGLAWAGGRLVDRAMPVPGDEAPSPGAPDDAAADDLDYRLVALGALLPDLIDKPLGWILLRKFFQGNDHLFGHALLFGSTITLAGLRRYAHGGGSELLAVGVGSLAHLALDPLAKAPQTLFWPLRGWSFLPKVRGPGIAVNAVIEVAAGGVLLLLARSLDRQGRLEPLLLEGRLVPPRP
jgi:hypothetical protein